jgi:hypothetical protein
VRPAQQIKQRLLYLRMQRHQAVLAAPQEAARRIRKRCAPGPQPLATRIGQLAGDHAQELSVRVDHKCCVAAGVFAQRPSKLGHRPQGVCWQ